MSERTTLPIGSVVRVREGVEPVMMINYCPDTKSRGKNETRTIWIGLINRVVKHGNTITITWKLRRIYP